MAGSRAPRLEHLLHKPANTNSSPETQEMKDGQNQLYEIPSDLHMPHIHHEQKHTITRTMMSTVVMMMAMMMMVSMINNFKETRWRHLRLTSGSDDLLTRQ